MLRCIAVVLIALIVPRTSYAAEWLNNTFLLDAFIGSKRSALARNLSVGGYELSDGTFVDFRDWYEPSSQEFNILFLTQLNNQVGLTWGFSTGERGEKYRIDPGLWLGFIALLQLSERSSVTFSAVTLVGGDFNEKTCQADYGRIAGLQEVNCRLAASLLPPAETLQYLEGAPGDIERRLSVNFVYRF